MQSAEDLDLSAPVVYAIQLLCILQPIGASLEARLLELGVHAGVAVPFPCFRRSAWSRRTVEREIHGPRTACETVCSYENIKEGMVVLVQYTGFYRYVATILNGFDVKVPNV